MQRSVLVKSVATAAATLILSAGFSLPAKAAETPNPIDTNSRSAVSNAYKTKWIPTTTVKSGWTGSVATCDPGTQTPDSLAKGLDGINFYRGLNGLDSVTLTDAQNQKAQAAALIMEANSTLTHYPTSDMKCYTELGKSGAGTSNLLYYSPSIPSMGSIVELYMDDPGASNTYVGHRRWILNPTTTTMGFGTTTTSNAINVIGGGYSETRAKPTFMAVPNAGFSPQQLEPNGRWSLSSSSWDVRFTNATVTVKDAAGVALPVTKHPVGNGYGPNTLAFEVAGVKTATGSATSDYTVTVSNIDNNGTPMTHTYTTKLFDGNDPGATTTPTPTPTPNPTFKSTSNIVAIDASGVLWNYHDLKTPRTRVLSGFGNMDSVHLADWNGDGIADLIAKEKSGILYLYRGVSTGGFMRSAIGSSGWQDYEIDVAKWKKVDTKPSIIAKNKVTGEFFVYSNPNGVRPGTRVKMGSGWGSYSLNVLDWDKDGNMDVLANSANTGYMYLYRTNGAGAFIPETRKVVSTGWKEFNSVTTVRNLQGATTDGLLARDASGTLFHYKTNTGSFAPRTQVGTGWLGYNIAGN